ncbi:MAG TPA: alkaline phosphatase family protein [Polyangia bacterium]|nr:alkaline phosphatase family protein [Polyangia bacterium]
MMLRPAAVLLALAVPSVAHSGEARGAPRNAIIFVADGLRPLSVNPTDAPTLARLQKEGVVFANSHSLFPTVTTANASAIATGHHLGDTGDFANTLFVGGSVAGSATPFIEDDQVLAELDARFRDDYLGEATLLAVARGKGFTTAAVGKLGPTLIQDVAQGSRGVAAPSTIFLDDRTGTARGGPLDPAIAAALTAALGGATPPARSNDKPGTPDDNGFAGDSQHPGTRATNARQQRYLANAVTKVLLPEFKRRGKPFVLVFWSRDPDATQHNQGDSLGDLSVGINGPTSKAAVRDADETLGQILAAVEGDPALAASTDLFVTSDHGFSTVSRREVDAEGHPSQSPTTGRRFRDVRPGDLPPGFVAMDVAAHLGLALCDPDLPLATGGARGFQPVAADRHPMLGNGLVARACMLREPREARVIVAANGGVDLIYVPRGDTGTIADLAAFLLAQDYVDAVFADRAIPGALPLRDANLFGSALPPRPALVVALRAFARDPRDPLRTQVVLEDGTLQEGQGTHGSFGRADVTNTMLAAGPDFKRAYLDEAPASNADIAPTLAKILGLTLPSRGRLRGRVLGEALAGGPATTPSTCGEAAARPGKDGLRTVLHFQKAGGVRYLDTAQKTKGQVAWGDWVAGLPCAQRAAPAAKP